MCSMTMYISSWVSRTSYLFRNGRHMGKGKKGYGLQSDDIWVAEISEEPDLSFDLDTHIGLLHFLFVDNFDGHICV